MRFVKWRGVGLALALMCAFVVGLCTTPKANAGGLYHWWNGHTINGRATLAKDYRTGGVYYAPPIPYGEYTKNYTACLHEAAGAVHGIIGKVCGACRGLGCKVCGYLGCLHGMICGGCNGKGCGSCGGNGLTSAGNCGACGGHGAGCNTCGGSGLAGGGHGLGGHKGLGMGQGNGHLGHGGNNGNGVAYVGPGGLTSPTGAFAGQGNGNGLGDPTCGLCGMNGRNAGQTAGPIAATPRNLSVAGNAMPSAQAQAQPSAQSVARSCSLCGGRGQIGSNRCGGCAGQGKIFGLLSGVKCGTCGGNGRNGANLCGSCGGAGLLSGLKCGSCGGLGHGANGSSCGTCGGKGLLASAGQCGANALNGAAACGACAGSGLLNGVRCAVCNGTGLIGQAVHHVASTASRAVHHVASTAHGMAQKAMWKMGKGGVEYFVGPGGPVPITPGYVNWVNPFRSPRDFFAFPPYVDQAFNSTSYSTPLYQEPARSATVVTPAPVERDRVRVSTPFPTQNGNTEVNVPAPPAPGAGFQRDVVVPGAANRNVPPPPPADDDMDDNSSSR